MKIFWSFMVVGLVLSLISIGTHANSPPVAVCDDVTVQATGLCYVLILASALASNSTDADNDPLVCRYLPYRRYQAAFPIGSTVIDIEVSDLLAISTCTSNVTIVDSTIPTITCPLPVSKNTDPGKCTANLTLAKPTVSDNCPTTLASTPTITLYPKGVTPVTYTATDTSGNVNSCAVAVTVQDKESPTMACVSALTQSTDTGKCTATVAPPTASDNCDPPVITSIPAVSSFPKGSTTVVYTAKDSSGNNVTCPATKVTVVDSEKPSCSCADITTTTTVTYRIGGADNCLVSSIYVVDTVSLYKFGPFPNGTTFQYKYSSTSKDTQKKLSTNSYALTGKGPAKVVVTDSSSNVCEAACVHV